MSESKSAEPAPQQMATLLKKKMNSLFLDIKAIKDQGLLAVSDPLQVSMFKGMYATLNLTYDKFIDVWDNLLTLHVVNKLEPEFPNKSEEKILSGVKQYYYQAHASNDQLTNKSKVVPMSGSEGQGTSSTSVTDFRAARARLPKLTIPQFSGKITDWPLFRDTYKSLIHGDETLTNIEKYHFLIGSLSDEALSVIKSIELLGDNYDQAWLALTNTFENKRKLASAYLQKILEFEQIKNKPTIKSLKNFLSLIGENVNSFLNLKINDSTQFILFELAIRCLDNNTRQAFELENTKVDFPKFSSLESFVRNRVQALELSEHNYQPVSNNNKKTYYKEETKFTQKPVVPKDNFRTSLFVQNPNDLTKYQSNQNKNSYRSDNKSKPSFECYFCKKAHKIIECPKYNSASPSERRAMLSRWTGCINCLYLNHQASNCLSKFKCRFCSKPHHSTLCLESSSLGNLTNSNQLHRSKPLTLPDKEKTAASLNIQSTSPIDVLLGTALVQIKDENNKYHKFRIVVDSGSQYSFITEECIKTLGFSPANFKHKVSGIGQSILQDTKGKIKCTLRSLKENDYEFSTEAVVVSTISQKLPQVSLPSNLTNKYTNFDLADPYFWHPAPISFLLGADLFMDIIEGGPITVDNHSPKVLNTVFGYIVIGRFNSELTDPSKEITSLFSSSNDITKTMDQFWEVEEVNFTPKISEDDEWCLNHFKNTHSRSQSGRFTVSLPFKSDIVALGASINSAKKRLFNLETKLSKNNSLRYQYSSFMREYLDLGHMQLSLNKGKYYIPHHAILKNGDPNCLRVVFDASAPTTLGSLNNHLRVGPKLQKDICMIILKFRKYPVALTSDIIKMFRQITVNNSDRDYLHIFWRFNPEDEVQDYELTRLFYGIASAPFLAQQCIRQLVEQEGNKYPLAARVLSNDIFIDDIVTSVPSLSEALELKLQLISLLRKGCFELSKWCSNEQQLLIDYPIKNVNFNCSEMSGVKILGLQWNPVDDVLCYNITLPDLLPTKRSILSCIGRIYDPLGYLSPIIFYAKTIMQQTWQLSVDWDEPVPDHLSKSWKEFHQDLSCLSNISIPRYICTLKATSYQLIGFCDASQKGYSANIYLRIVKPNEIKVFLLKAKTKLAPLKTISIPRLELCGALLLTNLYNSIKDLYQDLPVREVILFTDSTVVLGWLHTPPYKLKTFVANRVSQINDLVNNNCWKHVSSEDNPADCSSRGILPRYLIHHSVWWSGPSWLTDLQTNWPSLRTNYLSSNLPETKESIVTLTVTKLFSEFNLWTENFSSYIKLIHSLAYVLRFIDRCKGKIDYQSSLSITASEFKNANLKCINLLQQHYYQSSSKSKNYSDNILNQLNVFKDQHDLLRVGGRLSHSNLSEFHKHPILLPRRSHFTTLLVDHYHKINLHTGVVTLQSIIQQKYWIPSARSLIKERKLKCLTCRKLSKRVSTIPLMGDLPSIRFSETKAFHHVGVDFAGPFMCRESLRRKSPIHKAYLCVFVCLSTKAVHLEVASNLSTEAFIDVLDRFVARRGIPAKIISDCGTNFVGASSYLKDLVKWQHSRETQNTLINHTSCKGIDWSFNPPYAPHFGGIYEAAVKSAKTLTRKVLGLQPFTEPELSTIFAKVEAILNSRPLTLLSSDVDDPQPLTPGHFLIGQPLTTLPESSLTEINENRLSRWQLLRQRVQLFWDRWRNEYLQTLQNRIKWTKHKPNLAIGDIVLVKETNVQPLRWPLGRVIAIHPGTDNIVRVVTIKTKTGEYKRPVVKLVYLTSYTNKPNYN